MAVLTMVLVGCGAEGHALLLDLRTDFSPVAEFVEVEVFLSPAGAASRIVERHAVDAGLDYVNGARLLERDGLRDDTYDVTVRLWGADGRARIERTMRVSLERERVAVTVVVSRDCEGVVCPIGTAPSATTCLGGRCVEPSCTPETPERCGDAGCEGDADCAAPVGCRHGVCVAGACLVPPIDEGCPDGSWCHPDDGCVPLIPPDASDRDAGDVADGGATVDATVDDGGTSDAGSGDGGELAFTDSGTVCGYFTPCACPAGDICTYECRSLSGCGYDCRDAAECRILCYERCEVDCGDSPCRTCVPGSGGRIRCSGPGCTTDCSWL